MKDLVTIASEIIAEKITQENLNDVLELTQTVHSPNLKDACFDFIKENIQHVFINKGKVLDQLSKPDLLKIFSETDIQYIALLFLLFTYGHASGDPIIFLFGVSLYYSFSIRRPYEDHAFVYPSISLNK